MLMDRDALLWRGHTPEDSGRYPLENSLLAHQLEACLRQLDRQASIAALEASMSVM
jgi:hypothetical protein